MFDYMDNTVKWFLNTQSMLMGTFLIIVITTNLNLVTFVRFVQSNIVTNKRVGGKACVILFQG